MIQLDLLNHCHCIHCYAILLDIDVLTALYHASSTVMYFLRKAGIFAIIKQPVTKPYL